ncbi:hypothetical protein [Scytonema sp. NUACC26]|uniref:hypothetical protein n=1 Tax=Scytonema sp. NUACC26 TaxID=3140176 RepID=UPI0034DC8EB1
MMTSIKIILPTLLLVGLGIVELLKMNDASKSPQPVAIMPQHDNSFVTSRNKASTSYLNEIAEQSYSFGETTPETKNDSIPVSLNKISTYSKIIYALVKSKDWQNATENVFLLEESARGLNTEINGEKLLLPKLNSKIVSLKATIAAKNHLAAMHNANQITLIAATIAMHFQAKIPIEVTQLNYYGRELEIWASTGNKAWLHKTASNMCRTWYAARPTILTRGGIARARKFDRLINRVEVASSATEYSHLAPPLLNEMDDLENVFLTTQYANPSNP